MRELKDIIVKCTSENIEDIVARFLDYIFLKVLGIEITYFPFLPNTNSEWKANGQIVFYKKDNTLEGKLEGTFTFERSIIGLKIAYEYNDHTFNSSENIKVQMTLPGKVFILQIEEETPLRTLYHLISKKEACAFSVRYMMRSTGSEK